MQVHAGEMAGPDDVRTAVEVMHASRVGHGYAATKDDSLMQLLRERQVRRCSEYSPPLARPSAPTRPPARPHAGCTSSRAADDHPLCMPMGFVIARQVHLEACPGNHPQNIRDVKMFKSAGLNFGLNTDDPADYFGNVSLVQVDVLVLPLMPP